MPQSRVARKMFGEGADDCVLPLPLASIQLTMTARPRVPFPDTGFEQLAAINIIVGGTQSTLDKGLLSPSSLRSVCLYVFSRTQRQISLTEGRVSL